MKIHELEIFTSKLKQQTTFYTQTLGLSIVEQTSSSASFQIGNSKLKLVQKENSTPYHYAINIPANQEKEALEWLKQKVEILKDEELEIQHFDFWDAYAVYFYDEDKNIIELIARKTLKNESDQPFSEKSLLEISEIGVPTLDIEQEYQHLNTTSGIPIYSGSTERFCAIGDEHGLFIIINTSLKKEWFPTEDKPFFSSFKIKFAEGNKEFKFAYTEGKIRAV
ncbi:MAG: VOC family protein [Flavobacteriales bacterium]|nr:VOC family protein [Flavobacteriales bacterium]